MLQVLLILVLLIFAIQAIRAQALITSALWLAGVSAILSVLLYLHGARLVSVVELSVGAGLVTVLFVFAINIAGDDAFSAASIPPLGLILAVAALFVGLLAWYIGSPEANITTAVTAEAPIRQVIWDARGLDLLVQVVLIFSGVLGLLGLLAETKPPLEGSMALEVSALRDRELQASESHVMQIQDGRQ